MQYYYLVSGLPEYHRDADKGKIDFHGLRQQIAAALSDADRRAVELLYTWYDIQNIIRYVEGSSLPFNALGNLSESEVRRLVDEGTTDPELPDSADEDSPRHRPAEDSLGMPFAAPSLPDSIAIVIDRFKERNPLGTEDFEPVPYERFESELYKAYYTECARSRCKFLKEWNGIDRVLRNITAAYKARAMKADPSEMLIEPDPEIREQLVRSQASDFGFGDTVPYLDRLLAILAIGDFVEREHKMDTLRWEISEDLSEGDFFGIAYLMNYLIHLNIMYRWIALGKDEGRTGFRRMVEGLTAVQQNFNG